MNCRGERTFAFSIKTDEDLLSALVPFFKAGLQSNEFCLWVISGLPTKEKALKALKDAVPDLDQHLKGKSIGTAMAMTSPGRQ